MANPTFRQWLENHHQRIAPMEKDLGLAAWNLATTGKKSYEEELAKRKTAYRKIYANAADFTFLTQARKEAKSLPEAEARQLEVLWQEFAQSQFPDAVIEELSTLETEVEGIYSNFRGQVDGKPVDNNAIRTCLKSEADPAVRKNFWLASKQIGKEVVTKVMRLIDLRNQGAKACGFANYYQMSLELNELSEKKLFALLDDLAAQTDQPFRVAKEKLDREIAERFKIDPSQLRPWHYADPFFQEAPPTKALSLDGYFEKSDIVALTQKTFADVGLPIEPILENSDLFGRDGKDQHAFCTMIGRSKDVRVLCNVQKNEYWMSTMLHEFGHAVYDYYLGKDLPYFLYCPAHTLATEAIAMLFGRLTREDEWLSHQLGLADAEVKKITAACRAQQSFGMLIFVRWVLVMTNFEKEMYRDPKQDLNRLWWKLVKRYQGIEMGEDRNAPDWASKLHLALAPVYYQNYLLGELIASQLQNHIRQQVSPGLSGTRMVKNPTMGAFLKEDYFQHGARLRWDHLVEKATGQPLKPDFFVRQFVTNS